MIKNTRRLFRFGRLIKTQQKHFQRKKLCKVSIFFYLPQKKVIDVLKNLP